MNRFSSIFSQLLQLFPRVEFQNLVTITRAERHAKGFTCWGQFVAMLFCQLGRAHSLREITGGLRSCEGKLKHLGITAPSHSTLAYANEHRPWELYQQLFLQLFERCRVQVVGKRKFRFKNKLMSMDSSTIDLCLEIFDWAKFRRTKGAIKLHLLLDHDGYLPSFAIITEGNVSDIKVARQFHFDPGTIVVDDRGYNDYALFGRWTAQGVYFVTRMKDNALYEVIGEREVPRNSHVFKDEMIEFRGAKAIEKCPSPLRRIEVYDSETEQVLVFLTNNLKLGATTIAAIYKERWQIGVSREVRVIQSVKVRPRLKDSRPCSLEGTVAREQDGEALRHHSLKGGCATFQVVTCSERRRSLVTRIPVAETVDNERRQQEITGMSRIRCFSPAGYQRRHGTKGYAETGEALGARRRNLDEEGPAYNREWEVAGMAPG